jgi:hypothetical protein
MSARPQSINDETPVAPRLRKDQRRRISDIIRTSDAPITALYAVRNFLSTGTANFDNDDTPSTIQVSCVDGESKMSTQYQFKLAAPIRLDSPTL